MGHDGDRGLCGCAEMGANLPAVALGTGRSAVAVSAGEYHTCALLVRCGGHGSGLMMIRRKSRLGNISIPRTGHSCTSTLTETAAAPRVGGSVGRPAVFDARDPFVLPLA